MRKGFPVVEALETICKGKASRHGALREPQGPGDSPVVEALETTCGGKAFRHRPFEGLRDREIPRGLRLSKPPAEERLSRHGALREPQGPGDSPVVEALETTCGGKAFPPQALREPQGPGFFLKHALYYTFIYIHPPVGLIYHCLDLSG